MKKTIFISSTYKDLVKERKAVWELPKRYDVNIVGMETLCKLYPEIFKPEIWLSENPPQIKQPKKKLVKRSK